MADGDYDHPLARFRRIPPSLALGVVIIVSIAMMVVDIDGNALAPVQGALATIAYPFQSAASFPGEAFDYLERYFNRSALIEKNDRLRQKNLLLQSRLQKLVALKSENARLRSLLGSAAAINRHVLIAQILSSNPNPYRHRVKLDKGRNDGVFVGQALIEANGIVGQVVGVAPETSHAVLITDPGHGIPVEVNRNGLETIARGTGRADMLELPFLPVNADVQVGDLLVSSGLAGRYPAGYPVARVTSVSHRPGREFLHVLADPAASLNRGRMVLLVWNSNTAPGRVDGSDNSSDKGDSE